VRAHPCLQRMEPISAVLGLGILSSVAVHRGRKIVLRRRQIERALPKVLLSNDIDDEAPLNVLVVRISSVRLAAGLRGRVKVRVKCGRPCYSVACSTEEAAAPTSGEGEVGVPLAAACIFLAHNDEELLRFRLCASGAVGRVLAQAEVLVQKCVSADLPLQRVGLGSSRRVGGLAVSAERLCVRKGDLHRCLLQVGAQLQSGAALAPCTPMVQGVVVADPAIHEEANSTVVADPVNDEEVVEGAASDDEANSVFEAGPANDEEADGPPRRGARVCLGSAGQRQLRRETPRFRLQGLLAMAPRRAAHQRRVS